MPNLRDLLAKFQITSNPEALEKVNSGLDKTKNKLKDVGDASADLRKISSGLDTIKNLLEGIVFFEAIKKISELAEKFAQLGQNIKVTSESLGISVKEFQELTYTAGQSSVTPEQLSRSVMRLSRALYDARMGSMEAQEVFAHLGVPPGQIQGIKNADQALMLLSARLVTIHDPIAKLALVQKTLGRGSIEMVAFLSQGPGAIQAKMQQASKDGLILTDAQVNGLEKMNHAFLKLEAKGRVIMATIFEPLAPIVDKLADDFIRLFHANEKWLSINFEAFLGNVAYVLGFIEGFVGTFVNNIRKKLPRDGIMGEIFGNLAIFGTAGTIIAGLVGIGSALWGIALAASELAAVMIIIVNAFQFLDKLVGFKRQSDKNDFAGGVGGAGGGFSQRGLGAATGEDLFGNLYMGAGGMAGALAGSSSFAYGDTNIQFQFFGDPQSNAKAARSEIEKYDAQKRREALRSVQGNKVGSAP